MNGVGMLLNEDVVAFGGSTQFWFDALVNEPETCVMIIDELGRCEFVNKQGVSLFGARDTQDVIGRSLEDLLPGPMGHERITIARNAIASGHPVVINDVWHGFHMRVTMHPLPDSTLEQARLLMVVRPWGRLSATAGERDGGILSEIAAQHVDRGPINSLTRREREVLVLIAQGLSTIQIAKEIHRAVKTVEWHRSSLGQKLNVTNRVEPTRLAIQAGLVTTGSCGPTTVDRGSAKNLLQHQ